jgi:7-carboxy-7-deazaguanine synthase (Cx14CxxC type)
MGYAVKEIYFTLQGEGANAGRPAVFCRFSGCNLWSGREKDRADAICKFCDTDFVGVDGINGGRFVEADVLADAVLRQWPAGSGDDCRFVVCTGGEPLLQMDRRFTEALHRRGFFIAVETNGTIEPCPGLDWVCVSPKAGSELVVKSGDELKLVFPQEGGEPDRIEAQALRHFFLQPMDGLRRVENTRLAIDYCLAHPRWRLSLQTHKLLGIQ